MLKNLCILLFPVLFFIVSCGDKPTPEPTPDETNNAVLIYMSADNNLYSNALNNISQIEAAAKAGDLGNNRVMIYIDAPSPILPKLLEATSDGLKTIEEYETDQNSADKEVLRGTIARFKELVKAEKYGLVLWSHASGWMFKSVGIRSNSLSLMSPTEIPVPDDFYDYPLTKSYGSAIYNGSRYEIDIPDLKSALDDGGFESIIFDCCYMGSVEVLYELRNKAKYIISSPTEILAEGFPYNKCIKDMLLFNLEEVCSEYFNHYTSKPSLEYRSATISLTDCSQLEQLATTVSAITLNHTDDISALNPRNIQCFDRYSNHFMYDLGHYIESIASNEEQALFTESINKAIKVKYNTPSFINYTITKFSGLSSYIPGKLMWNNADNKYKELEWSKKVQPQQ